MSNFSKTRLAIRLNNPTKTVHSCELRIKNIVWKYIIFPSPSYAMPIPQRHCLHASAPLASASHTLDAFFLTLAQLLVSSASLLCATEKVLWNRIGTVPWCTTPRLRTGAPRWKSQEVVGVEWRLISYLRFCHLVCHLGQTRHQRPASSGFASSSAVSFPWCSVLVDMGVAPLLIAHPNKPLYHSDGRVSIFRSE